MLCFQNEGLQEDTDAQNTVGGLPEVGDIHIPEGLVHQIRHPDLPANIPGYMQVVICTNYGIIYRNKCR